VTRARDHWKRGTVVDVADNRWHYVPWLVDLTRRREIAGVRQVWRNAHNEGLCRYHFVTCASSSTGILRNLSSDIPVEANASPDS
jgi:hypothetical protein